MTTTITEHFPPDIVCHIQFILILDNRGMPLYTKFYAASLQETKAQNVFISELCYSTEKLNVSKDNIDIFNISEYTIVVNVMKEVAFFIGIKDGDNECLLGSVYDCLEATMIDLIKGDTFTKNEIINQYENIAIAIDEMINEGIVMNTNANKLNSIINLQNTSISKSISNSSSGFSFSSFLGYSSSNPTSNDNNNNSSSYSVFGSLLTGAKDYLNKTMNY